MQKGETKGIVTEASTFVVFLIIKGEMRDLPSFCPFRIRSLYV